MNNIDRFNDCAGRLLSFLYENFPRKTDLDFFEWLGKEVFEPGDDELEFCTATLEWLADAGYIAVGTFHTQGAAKVTLTVKGLEALKAVPAGLQGKGGIGDALVRATKEGTAEMVRQLAARLFTEGFRLVASYV